MSKLRNAIKLATNIASKKVPFKKETDFEEKLVSIFEFKGKLLNLLDQCLWRSADGSLSDPEIRIALNVFSIPPSETNYDIDVDYLVSLDESKLDLVIEILTSLQTVFKEISNVKRVYGDFEEEVVEVDFERECETIDQEEEYERFEDSIAYRYLFLKLVTDAKIVTNPVLRHLLEKEGERLGIAVKNPLHSTNHSNYEKVMKMMMMSSF